MAAAKQHPGAPKPRKLGARVGALITKLEKLESKRDEKLRNAPQDIEKWYDEKRAKALAEADDDVLEKLGL